MLQGIALVLLAVAAEAEEPGGIAGKVKDSSGVYEAVREKTAQ